MVCVVVPQIALDFKPCRVERAFSTFYLEVIKMIIITPKQVTVTKYLLYAGTGQSTLQVVAHLIITTTT